MQLLNWWETSFESTNRRNDEIIDTNIWTAQVTKSYFKANDGLEELWSELDAWDPDKAEKIDFSKGNNAK
jgi:hypothetical protein